MYPQFICIGAQKSGTTWLYQNIRFHPEIWLPPMKELYYFEHPESKPSLVASLLGTPALRLRLRRIINYAWRSAKEGQHIGWFLRYLLLPRHDEWYASLFSPGEGQIAGELTPNYDILDAETVARIHTLMPTLKIIYLLRNPIERTWSQANRRVRQRLFQGKHTDPQVIQQFMDSEEPHRRSDYFKTLQVWESVYQREQIFIGFFEQILENPRQLLLDIYQFLGVDSSEQYIPESLREKRNVGHYSRIPDHWAFHLAQQYHDSLKLLHQRFDNSSTASWLAFAEQQLSSEPKVEDKTTEVN